MPRIIDEITEQLVVPVLRCVDVDDALATARACARGGLRVIELTRSTPHVERAIERLTADDGLAVGLGTIANARQIGPAVSAGASFVVSFCAPDSMVDIAHAHNVVAIPGAFTPSEVEACMETGADAVKLFPASQLSPSYVRELRSVLPQLRVMATGGLTAAPLSLQPWLAAGVWAVGLGGALGTAATVGEAEVRRRARRALEACRRTEATATTTLSTYFTNTPGAVSFGNPG